jgi:hypothetical protein
MPVTQGPATHGMPPVSFANSDAELRTGTASASNPYPADPPSSHSVWLSALADAGDFTASWSFRLWTRLTDFDPVLGGGGDIISGQYSVVAYAQKTAISYGDAGDLIGWTVDVQKLRWLPRFYVGTGYLKLWWQEQKWKQNGSGGMLTFISSTDQSWTWTPTGTAPFCMPGDFNVGDESTWPVASAPIDFLPDEPEDPDAGFTNTTLTLVTAQRWSFLPDYTPPSDGSANGFPA